MVHKHTVHRHPAKVVLCINLSPDIDVLYEQGESG